MKINNLHKYFVKGDTTVDVLKGIDFNIDSGETVAITGPSGSGKTTFLQILGLLDTPSDGSVSINGKDESKSNESRKSSLRNQYFGFIYQFHHLIPEFSALENVMMPLLVSNQSISDSKEKSTRILDKIGMHHRLNHKPNELSGGECQRVAIARALVNEPKFILADEPTGNLDPEASSVIFNQFMELRDTVGSGLILVTHDQALAEKMSMTYRIDGGILIRK
ncbi:MAG: lipoprotein-releasing system ATP-binding protein LolD [Acidimicrobiaceae bacterium]|nr:lipoprotein-releasing system ATP-binding protein LolD [Acidimicrobiaceae bacterium]